MVEKLVSCDGHLVEPLAALPVGAAYAGPQQQFLILGEGYECPPLPVWTSVGAGRVGAGPGFGQPLGLADCPGAWRPEVRAAYLTTQGLGAEVLYPTFASLAMACGADGGMEAAWRYNTWAAQWASSTAFYPLLLVPALFPKHFRTEMENAGGDDPVGVLLPQRPREGHWREYLDGFRVAAEAGLVVHWHAFTQPTTQSFKVDPLTQAWQGIRAAQDILLELMLGGVFKAVPHLKVVFAEMDCGWVPHFKTRVQRLVGKYGQMADLGCTESDVHDWLAHNVYFAVQDVAEAQYLAPSVNTLWGWDWPHADAVPVPQFGSIRSRDVQVQAMNARALQLYPRINQP